MAKLYDNRTRATTKKIGNLLHEGEYRTQPGKQLRCQCRPPFTTARAVVKPDVRNQLLLPLPQERMRILVLRLRQGLKYIMNAATMHINEYPNLRSKYELLKKGRSYQSITLYVITRLPQQLPIPFELEADDAKMQVAHKHLEAVGIAEPKLVQDILIAAKGDSDMMRSPAEDDCLVQLLLAATIQRNVPRYIERVVNAQGHRSEGIGRTIVIDIEVE